MTPRSLPTSVVKQQRDPQEGPATGNQSRDQDDTRRATTRVTFRERLAAERLLVAPKRR
jgi:hypothetical protein